MEKSEQNQPTRLDTWFDPSQLSDDAINFDDIRTTERKSILNRSKIEYVDWNCNPFVGCGHSCQYCYARMIDLRFKKVPNAVEWHKPQLVKNYMDLIEKKIHLVGNDEEIFLSTMTDIYGADVHNLGVARKIITRFQEAGLKYRLLTKSGQVVKDADLFAGYKKGLVGLSITTDRNNKKMVKKWEPRTDDIAHRLWALNYLNEWGDINLWVSSEPFLPETDFYNYLLDIIYYGGNNLKEIVVGKMNYQAGMDDKFDWQNVITMIEYYRDLQPSINWHYKKETTNYFEKHYPEMTPEGGYP